MGQLLPGEEQDLHKTPWVTAVSLAFPVVFGEKEVLLEDPPSQTTASLACWTRPWLES